MICARAPELDALQTLAKELGVENQIHLLSFRADVKELLIVADIFLFTTYQEGLPHSMMEAMAAGLPCIATKTRGNTDLIKDCKDVYLRRPKDIEGFAEAIKKLTKNAELRTHMGLYNLGKVTPYDEENVKKEMKKIYKGANDKFCQKE